MKFGIMVRDLGASELNWRLVTQANLLTTKGYDPTFFYETVSQIPIEPRSTRTQTADAWDFKAPIIATSLSTAKKLGGFPSKNPKIFYVWDLEWLRFTERPFYALRAVYANPKLQLVARTEEHARLLRNLWGANVVGIEENCGLGHLLELTKDTNGK